jgi:hypothetical protein
METRNDADRAVRYDGSAPPPADAKASVFEDFIDIFHAPSQVFARRANSGFGVQLLIISLVAAALAFANRGYSLYRQHRPRQCPHAGEAARDDG